MFEKIKFIKKKEELRMSFNANKLITTPIDAFTLLVLCGVLIFVKMSYFVSIFFRQNKKVGI